MDIRNIRILMQVRICTTFQNYFTEFFCQGCERKAPIACTRLLTVIAIIIILITLPLSLIFVVKVVQEFERAVIFRLGRLLAGGARGPGVFFVVPCVDRYEIIDMRTQTFDIPPQGSL